MDLAGQVLSVVGVVRSKHAKILCNWLSDSSVGILSEVISRNARAPTECEIAKNYLDLVV